MRKNILIGTMLLLFTSCDKDKYTILEAWLYNTTNHYIIVLPYTNGVVSSDDTIRLKPNDSLQFGLSTELGNVTGPGFNSDYIQFETNPVMVVYDDSISIAHYNTVTDSTVKYYSFESKRNILNPQSYQFTRNKDKKGVYTNLHKYIFTEQDYLDAKD